MGKVGLAGAVVESGQGAGDAAGFVDGFERFEVFEALEHREVGVRDFGEVDAAVGGAGEAADCGGPVGRCGAERLAEVAGEAGVAAEDAGDERR